MNKESVKSGRDLTWWILRGLMALLDLAAFNFSYYLALVIRFYVNGAYREVALNRYLPAFEKFAPWYTVLALAVFLAFRLYSGRWRQAGLHDLNRIALANAVTVVIQVAGTLIFVTRMPLSYYGIGALLQLALTVAYRFAWRLVAVERARLRRKEFNVMIVGTGETARAVRRQIENNRMGRPAVIFDRGSARPDGTMLDGVPVVGGLEQIPEYVKKYNIHVVVLADSLMPEEVRENIRAQVRACPDVELQDYSAGLSADGAALTPRKVMAYITGPVILDGVPYPDGEAALAAVRPGASVRCIRAEQGTVVLETEERRPVMADPSWAEGRDVSFF